MLKFQEIEDAWRQSQQRTEGLPHRAFYDIFQELTGLTQIEVRNRFNEWNDLTHEEAERIAEKHGTTVRDGGFQAYLAESGENVFLRRLTRAMYSDDVLQSIAEVASKHLTDEDISDLREALAEESKANSAFMDAMTKTSRVKDQVLRRVLDRWTTASQPSGDSNA